MAHGLFPVPVLGIFIAASAFPVLAVAEGVPSIDAKKLALELLTLDEEQAKTGAETQENARHADMAAQLDQQIAAAEATLARLTETSTFVPGLEALGAGDLAAAEIYAIEDGNPYASRLFGEGRDTIEQMIVETVEAHAGHPALARAGINAAEFRCWFQGLVKQESNFSIGARSPVGAFGLTQIMPATAQDLGIHPAYYDDPRLQLDGGARYLLRQLDRFGSMPLALAAYNAGPGAVETHGGIPPYEETQTYIRRITANYTRYATRIEGVDAIGTLDPRDMVIAEASNIADAGMSYASTNVVTMRGAMTRLTGILGQIETTGSVKAAMDLNSYARAEVARIANVLTRLKSVERKLEGVRTALLLEAYAEDAQYLNVSLEE
jgi:soluble lytic murein transglycosylase-like protein